LAISDVYSQTLSTLTAARTAMLSTDWQASLATQNDPAVSLEASQQLVEIQKAITELSNSALADIATQMSAQQDTLQSATKDLAAALQNIKNVQNVITTVTSILNTVSQIVPLI